MNIKCGLCGKKHKYWLMVDEVKMSIPSAGCKKCSKELNFKVLGTINKLFKVKE